jgi:hypothetical protein
VFGAGVAGEIADAGEADVVTPVLLRQPSELLAVFPYFLVGYAEYI